MKSALFLPAVLLALTMAVGGVGCKKTQKGNTPIPARTAKAPGPTAGPGPIGGGGTVVDPNVGSGGTGTGGVTSNPLQNPAGFGQTGLESFEGMLTDTNAFAAATVYFDFDSSVVKSSEQEKAASVAEELKLKPDHKLLIDGHCDERGTEGYNSALGERRALSLREHLIGKGIGGERIRTRTWGEDRPVDLGQDEAAWSRNRRGEFILLLPAP
jgi:outer membrane protein OmpA-like peptidoglycan-associated protein